MPVYDYGFIQSDRPLTAAELARAQAQLGIGTSLDDLKEYYRQRYGRGAPQATQQPQARNLVLRAGEPVPELRSLPLPAGAARPALTRYGQAAATAPAPSTAPITSFATQVPVLSPSFQGTLASLEEYWQRTMPTYMPYAPGTPTFVREKWEREQALTEQEKKLAMALSRTATFGKVATKEDAAILGVPQGTLTWEAFNAAAARAHELRLQQIKSTEGGTEKPNRNQVVGQLMQRYKQALDELWAKAGPEGPPRMYTQGGKTYYPVHETLFRIEQDLQNNWPQLRQYITEEDIQDIADYLFTISGIPREEYEQWKKQTGRSLRMFSLKQSPAQSSRLLGPESSGGSTNP
ncbi:MAG: hypothetical protein ACPLRW_07855 [Moorellales bacterium]